MGFACPVCAVPHTDAVHLANHLAFTAMTHGDDHEAWLDDNVPGWSGYGEAELAEAVADLAPDAEYEQVFEDTVRAREGRAGTHDHDHRNGREAPAGIDPETAAAAGRGDLNEAARAALAEARELTAEMVNGGTDEGEGNPESAGDAGDDGGSAGGDPVEDGDG